MSDDRDKPGGAGRRRDPGPTPSTRRNADSARPRDSALIVGRLMEHGRASYQFRAGDDPSYYVKVLTNQGERVLWGKDLERALVRSATQVQVGDLIGAQRIAREAVTVTERIRDGEGHVVRQSEHHAHRNRWRVETVKFFADRVRLARQLRDAQVDVRESVRAHPELKSTFLTVRAAEEFAARRIGDPKDRERFLELIRGAMAGSIRKGEPLPAVRLREPQKTTPRVAPNPRGRGRDDEPTR